MTDTSQVVEQSAKLLEDLRLMLEKGGQFVMEQAPPLAREIVMYGRIANLLWCVCGAILFWFGVRVLTRMVPFMNSKRPTGRNGEHRNDQWTYDELWRPAFIIQAALRGIGGVVGFVVFITYIEWLILSWAAPRLYLLKYVTNALRGGCN